MSCGLGVAGAGEEIHARPFLHFDRAPHRHRHWRG